MQRKVDSEVSTLWVIMDSWNRFHPIFPSAIRDQRSASAIHLTCHHADGWLHLEVSQVIEVILLVVIDACQPYRRIELVMQVLYHHYYPLLCLMGATRTIPYSVRFTYCKGLSLDS